MLSIFEIESLRLLQLRLEMIVKALARKLRSFSIRRNCVHEAVDQTVVSVNEFQLPSIEQRQINMKLLDFPRVETLFSCSDTRLRLARGPLWNVASVRLVDGKTFTRGKGARA